MARSCLLIVCLLIQACTLASGTVEGGKTRLNRDHEKITTITVDPPKPAGGACLPPAASQPAIVVKGDNGERVDAPAGSTVRLETREINNNNGDADGGSITTTGEKVEGKTVGTPAVLEMGTSNTSSKAAAGGLNSNYSAIDLPPEVGKYGGYGLGFILIIAGVILLVLPLVYPAATAIPFRQLGGWCAIIAGVTLIILVYIAASPILMGCLVAAGVLGGLGLVIWSMLKGAKAVDANTVTAESLVTVIDKLNRKSGGLSEADNDPATVAWREHIPQIYAYLKGEVVNETDSVDQPKVNAVVAKIKAKL